MRAFIRLFLRSFRSHPAPQTPPGIVGYTGTFALILMLATGCATMQDNATGVPIPLFTGPASATTVAVSDGSATSATPLQTLAAGIGQLADHPLFKLVIKDATDTQAWVNGPEGPTDKLKKFRASQCPTSILLATQDFQEKAKQFQAILLGLDSKLTGFGDAMAGSGPEIILFLTKLRYGQGPAVDPKAQVQAIKDDVTNRVTAVVDGCRGTVPLKQLDQVAKIAEKAGLVGISGGAAAPFLGLLP